MIDLLAELGEEGVDAGAYYNDGLGGYFKWRVEDDKTLTITFTPYDSFRQKLGSPKTESYRLEKL